jgi:methionyl aminopeptidase
MRLKGRSLPSLKTPEQIKIMQGGGRIAGAVLDELIKVVRPGITTLALDALAQEWITSWGGYPAFKKVPGYHHTLCTCVNNQVVHAIPNEYQLKNGDVLTIDLGVYYQGLNTDTAWTIVVGDAPPPKVKQFLNSGKQALFTGIEKAKVGNKIGDITSSIEEILTGDGYGIVDCLTGHGVGENLHQEPLVPNIGRLAGTGDELKEGLTIAIEPIYTDADPEVFLEEDEWTIVAPGSSLAAVFEHSVAITKDGPLILTPNTQH